MALMTVNSDDTEDFRTKARIAIVRPAPEGPERA
jgi:hypothetical protein